MLITDMVAITFVIHASSSIDPRKPPALKHGRPPPARFFSIQEGGARAAYIKIGEKGTEVFQAHPVEM